MSFSRELAVEPHISNPDNDDIGKPEFTQQQQLDIQKIAISYLKRNKLLFSPENLEAAILIHGVDALGRGLALYEKPKLDTKDSVRTYIKQGIESRDVVQQAAGILCEEYQNDFLNRSTDEPISPYAFKYSTFSGALQEHKNFLLEPDINDSNEIVLQAATRTQILPHLAKFAMETIDPGTQEEKIQELFPSPDMQAQLVRNMLTSIAYRGFPMPILSSNDLKNFMSQDIEEVFDSNGFKGVFEQICMRIGIDNHDGNAYLNDLLTQVKLSFSQALKRQGGLASDEGIFRIFSKNLLLLHPALEEERMILFPEKVNGPQDFSLWSPEMSVVMNGMRIPTDAALFRAIQQSEAQGNDTFRYYSARRAWRSMQKNSELEQKRLISAKKQRDSFGQELDNLENGEYSFDTALYHSRTFNSQDSRRFQDYSRKFHMEERIINSALARRKNILDLINQYGSLEELPDTVVTPDWLVREKESELDEQWRRSISQMERRIEVIQDKIQVDIFSEIDSTFPVKDLQDSFSVESLYEYLEFVQKQEDFTLENGIQFDKLSKSHVNAIIAGINESIRFFTYGVAAHSTQQIADRDLQISQLTHLRDTLLSSDSVDVQIEVVKDIYLFSLATRKQNLQELISLREQQLFQQAEEPDEVNPEMSKEDIIRLYKTTMVETIDPESLETQQNLHEWKNLANLWFSRIKLPIHVVPDRQGMIDSVNRVIERMRKRIDKINNKDKITNFDLGTIDVIMGDINRCEVFKGVIDHPLFPLKEAEGLPYSDFVNSMIKRIKLLRHTHEHSTTMKSLDIARQKIWQNEEDYLKRMIARHSAEIIEIETNHPAQTEFLAKMKKLNLVIPNIYPETTQEEIAL